MKLSRNYLWYIFRLYVVETKSHAKIIGVYIKYFYVIQPTYTPKYTRNFMQYKLVYFETKKNNNKKQHNYVGYRVVFIGCEHTILHIIRELESGRV